MNLRGKVSWFGGPDDSGVSPDEGLAFIYKVEDAPHLFLPQQPPGTTGLARRLDPNEHYIACRWDYAIHPKPSLLKHTALVYSPVTDMEFEAHPADWGPHQDTGRIADISPGLMDALGIETDDEVEVTYPYRTLEEAMPLTSFVISSGHSKIVRGASGVLDEVNEARKVVEKVAEKLRSRAGVTVTTFHDDTSTTQNQNLNTIVNFHNGKTRDLDVSVHFNAFERRDTLMGTEVLYVTQHDLAAKVSAAIASVGFPDRGAKKRTDLFFLNSTNKPAILLEVCFVDSTADAELYNRTFDAICENIATSLTGISSTEGAQPTPPPETTPPPAGLPTVEIFTTGDVVVYVNGNQVGTKG